MANKMSPTLIIIGGPTGIGKTDLSLHLARHFHTAIISADSRQCYREMSIGTAKPEAEILSAVKHYFINTYSISEPLSAADFEELALQYAKEIFAENDIAIVCGGTGLYIKALCEGLDKMPATDLELTEQLNAEFSEKGLAWLQETLSKEDPEFYDHSEQQNPHRLLRALAFKRSTGHSIDTYRTGHKKNRDFNIIKIGLELPRPELYERINSRVEKMMDAGLLGEVKTLLPYRHLKNLDTVGYSELFDYLDGKTTLDRAIELIRQHSRNYAKRQMTWFKKDKDFHWFAPFESGPILQFIDSRLNA
jgi:tRNA dimethylallyltransferase